MPASWTRKIAQAASLLALALPSLAQLPPGLLDPPPVAAPAQPNAFPLYPDMQLGNVHESWAMFGDDYIVRNVTVPTLTPFLPAPGKATGAAIIVAPGGAFMMLSMSHEGWNVAQKLADNGIAAFVLKYRLNETPEDRRAFGEFAANRMGKALSLAASGQPPTDIQDPLATQDAIAALRYVRQHAARWNIDPQRVGMIGFSAGAMATLRTVLEASPEDRPAFFGYIYGPMVPVDVPANAPPMFAAIAMDDELFDHEGFGIVESWRKAHRPVELHAYQRSNHGFGLGVPGTTSVLVMPEFVTWLASDGFLRH